MDFDSHFMALGRGQEMMIYIDITMFTNSLRTHRKLFMGMEINDKTVNRPTNASEPPRCLSLRSLIKCIFQ